MLATWIEAASATHPAAPALIAGGRTVGYADLAAEIERDARGLLAQGFAPGATLAALSLSSLQLARLAWSVSRLGGTLLPLNPAWPSSRANSLLDLAEADGVVVDQDAEAPSSLRRFRLSGPVGESSPLPRLQPAGRKIAVVIATSGSSGEPKGVMLSNANLEAAVLAARGRIPLAPGDVWLDCLPLYHIGGLSILYRCAQAGAAVLLEEGFDLGRVSEAMARHGVTHVSLVPAMLARLLDLGPPPRSLKYALIGGGPLSAALARRAIEAGWPLRPSYGMSEAASQVATLGVPLDQWREGMAGPPLHGLEVQIVDENGGPCSGTGRIRLRGPMVMAGYARPGREPGLGLQDGWFLSADLGCLDHAGNLVIQGRADDMLVSGGLNVHPAEAEALLLACPGVRDAALTALPDEVWGDRLAALVAGDAEEGAVFEWCRAALPAYLRPRLVVMVPELPRGALGKLERWRLPALVRASIPISPTGS